MGDSTADDDVKVYLFGKTYLANDQRKFFIQNDPVVHIATGDRHTIVVTKNGRAFAFGDNSSGKDDGSREEAIFLVTESLL